MEAIKAGTPSEIKILRIDKLQPWLLNTNIHLAEINRKIEKARSEVKGKY
ncbi:MAG: hypothetical protein ABDI07_09070 [Candidatus Kryptonium sp.]